MSQEGDRRVPQHVAMIMDGNGRWAKTRGLLRLNGHEEGAESVRCAVRSCRNAGVKYLTLYAFSTENWARPKAEVTGLMKLLTRFLEKQEYELHDNKVRLRVMGRIEDLPAKTQASLERVIAATKDYNEGHLILALSYGGREEISRAARTIAEKVKSGDMGLDEVNEEAVASCLYVPDVPDPDLLIRTSGEMRLSNFMLWQLSYAELYVTDVLWPDFREAEFKDALAEYARRQRRYGGI